MPKIIDQAADELLKHVANKNANSNNLILWDLGIRLVLMYMLFAILKGVFLFFTRQSIIVMSRNIEFDLKNEIFSKYQQLTISFYKNNKTGDLMNRISEDVSKVRELDNQSYNNLITEGLRHVVEYKKQHLSQRRKTRETLSNMICK